MVIYCYYCLFVSFFDDIYYIAMLRLPVSLSKSEKTLKVDEIILELGLKDCANTLIGDDVIRGISGI